MYHSSSPFLSQNPTQTEYTIKTKKLILVQPIEFNQNSSVTETLTLKGTSFSLALEMLFVCNHFLRERMGRKENTQAIICLHCCFTFPIFYLVWLIFGISAEKAWVMDQKINDGVEGEKWCINLSSLCDTISFPLGSAVFPSGPSVSHAFNGAFRLGMDKIPVRFPFYWELLYWLLNLLNLS